jgi:hypothetical protein
MADWTEGTKERLAVVQGELQQLDHQIEQLEQEIATIRDRRQEYANAVDVFRAALEWGQRLGPTRAPESVASAPPDPSSRWAGVGVMDAVRQVMAENPEWQTLERAPQVHRTQRPPTRSRWVPLTPERGRVG